MFARDPINKLNQILHETRRYFHDDNGILDLEALKNIYQVVAQQLLNSRKCYMNLQGSESTWQPSGHPGGNISMVHITHVKKTTLTDEVADDYLQLCNEGRFAKKCVPRGYIPDLNNHTQ